jgi:hypothetical protein
MKSSPRQDSHLHSLRSERSASALGYAGKNWHSRQEFRLQPPRSKRGTLDIELRELLEAHPGLAPGNSVLQTDGSRALPCALRNWGDQRDSHPLGGFHKAECCCLHHDLHLDPPVGAAPTSSPLQEERITDLCHGGKNCSREDLHLERPPSRGGMQRSYISGAKKFERQDRQLRMAAAAGIAPASPRLQRGANLSQLNSHWSLHEVTLPGLSVIDRLLCF